MDTYESNQRKQCCGAGFKQFLDQINQTLFCYGIQAKLMQTFWKKLLHEKPVDISGTNWAIS